MIPENKRIIVLHSKDNDKELIIKTAAAFKQWGYSIKRIDDYKDKIIAEYLNCKIKDLKDKTFMNTPLNYRIFYFKGAFKGHKSYGKIISPIFTAKSDATDYQDANRLFSLSLDKALLKEETLTRQKLVNLISHEDSYYTGEHSIMYRFFNDNKCSCGYNFSEFYNDISHVLFEDCEYPKWVITDGTSNTSRGTALLNAGAVFIGIQKPDENNVIDLSFSLDHNIIYNGNDNDLLIRVNEIVHNLIKS